MDDVRVVVNHWELQFSAAGFWDMDDVGPLGVCERDMGTTHTRRTSFLGVIPFQSERAI